MKKSLLISLVIILSLVLSGIPASAQSGETKLTASDGAEGDVFGYSVSLSKDTIIVGAYRDDDKGTSSGSAYVFVGDKKGWSEEAKLTAGDGAEGDVFGYSVSVSKDTIVVGAYGDDDKGSVSGSAYVFADGKKGWSEEVKLTAGDGVEGDYFGYSVSVLKDTIIAGAQGDDDNGSVSGSAYIFSYYRVSQNMDDGDDDDDD